MRSYIAIATLLVAASCGSISSTAKDGGTGGSPGTGGTTGTGGNGGDGGQGGGPSCEQIQAAYKTALAAARQCFVGSTNQCQKMAQSALGCTGCPIFVNDDSALSQYDNAWNQAGCSKDQVCPAIACLTPKAATCVASDAGGGTCVDVATPAL